MDLTKGVRLGIFKLPRRTLIGGGAALSLAIAIIALCLLLSPRTSLPKSFDLPTTGDIDNPSTDLLLSYISPDLADDPADNEVAGLPLPKSLEYSSYTVRAGDSIGSIAKLFGRRVDSIVSVNGIKSVKSLKAGTALKIPNMDGLIHIVARGESLGRIATDSKVDMTLIADANDLGSSTLTVGQSLFIPGARLQAEELKRIYGTTVIWPVRGPISSYFGLRPDPFTGVRRFHAGLDIVVDTGTPVKAAIDGKVADRGYNAIYGNYIILNHADGLANPLCSPLRLLYLARTKGHGGYGDSENREIQGTPQVPTSTSASTGEERRQTPSKSSSEVA